MTMSLLKGCLLMTLPGRTRRGLQQRREMMGYLLRDQILDECNKYRDTGAAPQCGSRQSTPNDLGNCSVSDCAATP
jgi:hypothetical protein